MRHLCRCYFLWIVADQRALFVLCKALWWSHWPLFFAGLRYCDYNRAHCSLKEKLKIVMALKCRAWQRRKHGPAETEETQSTNLGVQQWNNPEYETGTAVTGYLGCSGLVIASRCRGGRLIQRTCSVKNCIFEILWCIKILNKKCFCFILNYVYFKM